MPRRRAPVPWVPVAMAPETVWRSMSPRFGSARPSAWRAGFSSCRGVPAATRTRRGSRSTPVIPRSPSRVSRTPSVATSGVNEWPGPRRAGPEPGRGGRAHGRHDVVDGGGPHDRARACASTLPAQLVHVPRSTRPSEVLPLAAVGGDGVDELAAARRGARCRTARAARRPWRRASTPGRRGTSPSASEPRSGVWTSPAASVRRRASAAAHRRGHPGPARLAARDVAAAERRHHARRAGRRTTGSAKAIAGRGREVVVAVEERRPVQARPGGELGDDRVAAEPVQAAGAAGVDEAQVGLGPHGVDDRRPAARARSRSRPAP